MARIFLVPVYLLAVAVLSASVWYYSARQSIGALERRGQSDLALASNRLVGAIVGFRQLAVTLAGDPRLRALDTPPEEMNAVLQRAADLSGALDLVLLDSERQVRATAFGVASENTWRKEAVVERAFHGALGTHLMTSADFDRRAMLLAVPVFSPAGPVQRALVTVIDLEEIEADFRGSRPVVFMTDRSGVIYFANRSELVLRRVLDPSPSAGFTSRDVLGHTSSTWLGTEIWTMSAGRYLPRRAIHVTRDLPVIEMRAEAVVDARPAFATAFLQSAVVGFAFLLFGAAVLFVAHQRRVLALANEALESLVGARTRALSQANTALRAEVAERIEAETALKKAQADLIQAEKLSALGKMSAGISHELNQPLMAIRSFAENGALFLQRGETGKTEANLSRIGDLAARMARIIRNFRAFARQEKETVKRVNLVDAVHAAIDLAETRIERNDIDLRFEPPAGPVWVQGGEVRLQQVVLNLIANAIDAMTGGPERSITLAISGGAPVVLRVQDTGPGIAEPDRVFEPFYSTRSMGEAEGVGLGLSISYGLVQSFGGRIRGANAAGGGAIFTVELQPWTEEAAA